MLVPDLIDEVHRRVPATASFGTRWKAQVTVNLPHGCHTVAVAARIDNRGTRREQFSCDGVRVERQVLLRLTCPETECPHAVQVRAQWQVFHRPVVAKVRPKPPSPLPLMQESLVVVGPIRLVARPASFPCFTPCPHQAHPSITIDKTGFDLFEEGTCLGGGVAHANGLVRPRIPTLGAAEAYALARRLESQAVLGVAIDSSRQDQGPHRRA